MKAHSPYPTHIYKVGISKLSPLGIGPLHSLCDAMVSQDNIGVINALWGKSIFIQDVENEAQNETRARRRHREHAYLAMLQCNVHGFLPHRPVGGAMG